MPDILVVDDSPMHLDNMVKGATKVTRQHGGVVERASTVDEATSKIANRRFDIVVTDLRFESERPPLDYRGGFYILECAKRADPSTVVIVVTSFGTIELGAEAVRKGAFKWIERKDAADEPVVVREFILEALNELSSRTTPTGEHG